jgi:hypothetical protein
MSVDLDCNRCGECCVRGGVCMLRRWDHYNGLPLEFSGRCELLRDEPDGTKICTIMPRANLRDLVKLAKVVGTCDFPHLRVELPVLIRP